MGISGTAMAMVKEAATMVPTEVSIATIVRAVRQGCTPYDYILKFVRFSLSKRIGAILTVFFAPPAGMPEPFIALQIFWVAIIMESPPAASLATGAARWAFIEEPKRRRDAPVLPLTRVLRVAAFRVTMMVRTLAVLKYDMHAVSEARALTMAFSTFVLFRFFKVCNARSEVGSTPIARFFDNGIQGWFLGGHWRFEPLARSRCPHHSCSLLQVWPGRTGPRDWRFLDGLVVRGSSEAGCSSPAQSDATSMTGQA